MNSQIHVLASHSQGVAIAITVALAYLVSYFVTRFMLNYTQKHALLDIPNDRSSHTNPTPLGGGVGIVIAFLLAVAMFMVFGKIVPELAITLLGGSVLAIIGWLDDWRGVSALLRLVIHIAVAIWAAYWLGGLPYIHLGPYSVDLGHWGSVLSALGIVWMINLYNFMDGIDGLAGVEATTVGAFAGIFSAFLGRWDMAILSWALSLASLGFLRWNWPPAKIFMGDVGSGFLGFTFAVLAIASENLGGLPLIAWMLLLGVFVVDSTATLISRIGRGEKLSAAHREHVYQLAVQAGYSHKQVTTAALLTNCTLAAIVWWCLKSQSQRVVFVVFICWLVSFIIHCTLRHRLGAKPMISNAPFTGH